MAYRTTPPTPIIKGDLAQIQLKDGRYTTIDVTDLPLVAHRYWWAREGGFTTYAQSNRGLTLHQLLLGPPPAPGLEIDHIDGDGLNNQRSNLRWGTRSQNHANRRQKRGKKTSPYKGVKKKEGRHKWEAYIQHDYLGYYDTEEEAARAYDAAAFQRWGEYAKLNFPPEAI